MRITAALVEARHGDWRLEQLELADPAADEVIVRVAASGMKAPA